MPCGCRLFAATMLTHSTHPLGACLFLSATPSRSVQQALNHPLLLQWLGVNPHPPLSALVADMLPRAQQQLVQGTPQVRVSRRRCARWACTLTGTAQASYMRRHARMGACACVARRQTHAAHPCTRCRRAQAALAELQARVTPALAAVKATLEAHYTLSRGPTLLERLDWFTSLARCVVCQQHCVHTHVM
jgi:hypothetical protein